MKYFTTLLFFFPFFLSAQTISLVTSPVDDKGEVSLFKSLSKATLEPHNNPDFYFGFTDKPIWYKVSFAETSESPRYLRLGNPLVGEIDFYQWEGTQLTHHSLSGVYRPYHKKTIYTAGFIFDVSKKGDYYFKVRNESTHRLHFDVMSIEELHTFTRQTLNLQGFYLGITLLVVLIALTQWSFIKEKIYLYLAFSAITISITNAYLSGFLYISFFPENPEFSRQASLFITLSPIALILFFREFMQTRILFPYVDKILKIYIYLMPLTYLVNLFGLQMYMKLMYTNNLMMSLFAIGFGIYSIFIKNKQGIILFSGFIIRQIGSSIVVVMYLGMIPNNPFTSSANEIGIALQMVIYIVAISEINVRVRRKKEETIRRQNQNLENIIFQRTRELRDQKTHLETTLNHLRATQNQLIYSEKMTELGKLIAGVAHELNNPLSAIKASTETLLESNQNETDELDRSRHILSELSEPEMTSLKELISKNNDFGLVASYTERKEKKKTLKKSLSDHQLDFDESTIERFLDVGLDSPTEQDLRLLQDHKHNLIEYILSRKNVNLHLSIVRIAVDRASKIIAALKNFSRNAKSEERRIFTLVDSIETVLTIYQYKMKGKVSLKKTFLSDATILGWPEEIIQVWTNIILNALQAMEYKGNLIILTQKKDYHIETRIIDNGPGIPPEIQKKVFEPFFTTKELGEGTGMGLDLTRSIVKKHEGTISFQSEVGKTEFIITLPAIDFIEMNT